MLYINLSNIDKRKCLRKTALLSSYFLIFFICLKTYESLAVKQIIKKITTTSNNNNNKNNCNNYFYCFHCFDCSNYYYDCYVILRMKLLFLYTTIYTCYRELQLCTNYF